MEFFYWLIFCRQASSSIPGAAFFFSLSLMPGRAAARRAEIARQLAVLLGGALRAPNLLRDVDSQRFFDSVRALYREYKQAEAFVKTAASVGAEAQTVWRDYYASLFAGKPATVPFGEGGSIMVAPKRARARQPRIRSRINYASFLTASGKKRRRRATKSKKRAKKSIRVKKRKRDKLGRYVKTRKRYSNRRNR